MNSSAISILLVDDDELVREAIGAYLEDEGFTLYYAISGEEALASIDSIHPTICITDMRLPGISGEAFIREARALCPHSSYLIHTGMAYTLSDELRAIGLTPDDVFQKPIISFATFIDRIRTLAASGGTHNATT